MIYNHIDALAITRINVTISEPRGGFGDTAANLLMIERLAYKYQNSDTQLAVVYTDESKKQIKTLWPEFNMNLHQQVIRGLPFYEIEIAPKADYSITFSATTHPYSINKIGNKEIIYFEYGDIRFEHDREITTQSLATDVRFNSPINLISSKPSIAEINTGFANGLYVMDGFKTEDSNKKITIEYLKRQYPEVAIQADSLLGYAYCSSPELIQQYVQSIEKYAKKHQRHIVVVANQNPQQYNSNYVTVVDMKDISFDLNQKIIKSSDLPVLVTGDGSLSIAIEGKKPFFYSLYAWKTFNSVMLRDELVKRSSYFRKNKQAKELVSTLTRLDTSGTIDYGNMFLQFFEDTRAQNEFSTVLEQLTKEYSLVDLLKKDINAFAALKDNYGRLFPRIFWLKARESGSNEEAINKMERYIMNSQKNAQRRLEYIQALMSVNLYTDDQMARLLSKILTIGDSEIRFMVSSLIQHNHQVDYFKKIILRLTHKAQVETIKILKYVASQPVNQWGHDRIEGAIDTIHEIEKNLKKTTPICKNIFK